MASLSTIINRTPVYDVKIFNTSYNPENAYSHLDADASVLDSGWYQIPSSAIGMLKCKVDDSIYKKTTAEFEILQDDLWMYSLDTVAKREATVYHPVSANQTIDSDGTKLIIQIDDDGYTTGDTVGTVSITGTINSVPTQTEAVTISGNGSYVTENEFETIDTLGITSSGLSCHVAVFGNVGTPNTRHEIKISCDANSDDVYGLMFAGYMIPVTNNVRAEQTTVTIKCTDYTEFLMSNEFIVGNRAEYVCNNYSSNVAGGACSASGSGDAASHWYGTSAYTDANMRCYIGDMNTHHPNGAVIANGLYMCTDYTPSIIPLPYCGYVNKNGYAPSTETLSYAPIPRTYTLAMEMIKWMCRSIDYEVTSRPFDMAVKGYALVNDTGGVPIGDTMIPYDNYIGTIESTDLIKIDDEWMLVSTNSASTLGVSRPQQLTLEAGHSNNDEIFAYHCANLDYGSSALDQIRAANVKSTIYKTGTSLADSMMSVSSAATFVFWVDKFKQLQITELNLANPGATSGGGASTLALSLSDITKVTSIQKGGVVNKISSWVTLDTNQPIYAELDTDRIATDAQLGSDTDYDTSIALFGLHSEELRNPQLNSVSIDANDESGFKTFAYNYLKQHAYPKFTQSIVVDSFIPDEHNVWIRGTNQGSFSSTDNPLLLFTDEYNEHVDLLGRCIDAPDFNLEGTPIKTFIVEEIHYNIIEKGNFDARIVMSRISTKGDY